MSVRSDLQSLRMGGQTQACEATDLVEAVLRVAQQIRRLLNERLETCNLNDVRYAVLCMVSRSADRGGCSQSELATRLDQSESSVSMLIDRMRADRLLHRLHAPTDRRRRRLVLTEEGRSLLDQARRVYTGFAEALLQVFGGDAGLTHLLSDLSATLADPHFMKSISLPTSAVADSSSSADSQRSASNLSVKADADSSEISPAA